MHFQCQLLVDPVIAADGFTYEREAIELWLQGHDTSPRTNQPLEHKLVIPNMMARQQVIAWCEQNGVPVPVIPKPAAKPPAAGGGAAAAALPMLQKPVVMCPSHSNERVRVYCMDCDRAVCFNCAVDSDVCKAHTTKAFDPLLQELKTDREGWARAQWECDEGAEQLCAAIEADGDTKVRVYSQAVAAEVAQLQQQVRSAAAARSTAFGAILLKREEREELVAAATVHPDVAVKGSAAAAVVVSALRRVRAPIPPASRIQITCACCAALLMLLRFLRNTALGCRCVVAP